MRTRGSREGPFSYTWSFPICPHRVRLDLTIVEALQTELAAGPEHRQGLLLGETGSGMTDVDEWRTVPALDSATFAASLEAETRNVVGCYIIREGSAFILSPREVALVHEFFKKQGSVVLLIERRAMGPAEASFFFWRGDVFVHNLPLPFPFHAGILSGETPGLSEVPVAASSRWPAPTRAQRRALLIGLYAVSAIAAGGMVAAHLRGQRATAPRAAAVDAGAPPEAAAIWIPTQPKRDLELTWDPRAEVVSTATAGVLKIEDAGATRQMSLDVGELLLGSILYAPASDRIRVELTTLQRDGRLVPITVAAQLAAPSYTGPVAEALPPAAPKRQDARPLDSPEPELRAFKFKKSEAAGQAAQRRPPLKRFTWTAADRTAPAPVPILEAPHQAPPVVNPAVLTAALPPVAMGVPSPPSPPPPKSAPAPALTRTLPRSGRLIWTGTLLRRGIVELDGRSVSVGSLNGALPGAPVTVSVTPAEFGEDGLMVYTTDASRHNRVEPPSVGNGWNKVTYIWAPERVREIAILESPNPGNGFNRLTVRSDGRRCSMLLIDWTLR